MEVANNSSSSVKTFLTFFEYNKNFKIIYATWINEDNKKQNIAPAFYIYIYPPYPAMIHIIIILRYNKNT